MTHTYTHAHTHTHTHTESALTYIESMQSLTHTLHRQWSRVYFPAHHLSSCFCYHLTNNTLNHTHTLSLPLSHSLTHTFFLCICLVLFIRVMSSFISDKLPVESNRKLLGMARRGMWRRLFLQSCHFFH